MVMIYMALGLLLGAWSGYNRLADIFYSPLPSDKITAVEGRLLSDGIPLYGGKARYSLKVDHAEYRDGGESESVSGTVICIASEKKSLGWGRYVRFYPDQMEMGPVSGELVGLEWSHDLFRWRNNVLTRGMARSRVAGSRGGGLFTALFFGVKEDPGDPRFTLFRQAGAAHVLALSGMHLGILAFMCSALLGILFGRRRAVLPSIFMVALYIALIGPRPSLLRAGILFLFLGIGNFSFRKADMLHLVNISFLTVVLMCPKSVTGLSFQLSFLGIYGILLFTPAVGRFLRRWLPNPAAGALGASIAAQLGTSPLLVAVFGILYPAGIITGILLTPLVTVFIWIGMLNLLLGGTVYSGFILRIILDKLASVITLVARWGALVPGIEISLKSAGVYVGLVCIFCIAVLCILWVRQHQRILGRPSPDINNE